MRRPACLGRRYTPLEAAGDLRGHSLCPACQLCSCSCLLTAVPSYLALCAPSAMQLQPRSAFCNIKTYSSAVSWPQACVMEHSKHAAEVYGKKVKLLSKDKDITELLTTTMGRMQRAHKGTEEWFSANV